MGQLRFEFGEEEAAAGMGDDEERLPGEPVAGPVWEEEPPPRPDEVPLEPPPPDAYQPDPFPPGPPAGQRLGPLAWEAELNPEQLAAVQHGEGPQLVLAGAGSGKTRVITYRIAWLVRERGVDPWSITAVTFTNKAAGEMRERAESLVGGALQGGFVGTFHRFCLLLLRRQGALVGLSRDFAIYDTSDQLAMVKRALELEGLSETSFQPRAVLGSISAAKNRMQSPSDFEAAANDFYARKAAAVYRRYQGLLHKASAVDFDDMLFWSVRLLRENPQVAERWRERIRYLLVDEFQDTNQVQMALVQLLNGPGGSLTAVGDEDQGIYRWRGAELDNILRFEEHFPGATIRKLEQNYRSTQTILDASGALVEHNLSRRGKRLWTDSGAGEAVRLYEASDEGDEAAWIVRQVRQLQGDHELGDVAVLVRTHAQTRALEEELMRHGVPYALVGGVRFYDRAEIKDLIAYLRVLRNPRDAHSLERILNQPPRGIGKGTQALLAERAAQLGTPLWDTLCQEQALDAFPARAAKALRGFRDTIRELAVAARDQSLPELLLQVLERTGYTDLYRSGDDEGQSRLENLEELVSAAQEFAEGRPEGAPPLDELTAFLDHASLVADVDSWRQGAGGVSLMTLHSAKGLEFPVVMVAGLEEGVLPHFNSQGALEDVEEERRLLYVGMTRAREKLHLSWCRRRRVAGRWQSQDPSRFLEEIPQRFLDVERSPDLWGGDERAAGVYSFFGRDEGSGASGPAAIGLPRRSGAATGAGAPGELARGARVRHPKLGTGTVMEVSGTGDDARITVYFERWGKKKLVARFAQLEAG